MALSDAPHTADSLKLKLKPIGDLRINNPNRFMPIAGGFFMGGLSVDPQLGRGTTAASAVEKVTENWIKGPNGRLQCDPNGKTQCFRRVVAQKPN
jgi:hypothetical protein